MLNKEEFDRAFFLAERNNLDFLVQMREGSASRYRKASVERARGEVSEEYLRHKIRDNLTFEGAVLIRQTMNRIAGRDEALDVYKSVRGGKDE